LQRGKKRRGDTGIAGSARSGRGEVKRIHSVGTKKKWEKKYMRERILDPGKVNPIQIQSWENSAEEKSSRNRQQWRVFGEEENELQKVWDRKGGKNVLEKLIHRTETLKTPEKNLGRKRNVKDDQADRETVDRTLHRIRGLGKITKSAV